MSKENKISVAYHNWVNLEYARHRGGTLKVHSYDENETAAVSIIPSCYPKPTWDGFTKTDLYKKLHNVRELITSLDDELIFGLDGDGDDDLDNYPDDRINADDLD